jgi:hypothetical protein
LVVDRFGGAAALEAARRRRKRREGAHIVCHLLMILLTEPLLAEHLGDSPRREAA